MVLFSHYHYALCPFFTSVTSHTYTGRMAAKIKLQVNLATLNATTLNLVYIHVLLLVPIAELKLSLVSYAHLVYPTQIDSFQKLLEYCRCFIRIQRDTICPDFYFRNLKINDKFFNFH